MNKGYYIKIVIGVLLFATLFSGCNQDYLAPAPVRQSDGFVMTMGGSLTRAVHSDDILDHMRFYCFSNASTSSMSGGSGSWQSPFHHQISGVTRSGMTLSTTQMRAGDWDMVMVSGAGAVLTPPIAARKAEELLMYTYNPGVVQEDGSRARAHEVWHRLRRLPTIVADANHTDACAITRNMAMVKVIVERAVDVNTTATDHTIELHNVPDKISWAGTLLRTISPGVYATTTSGPDVLADPLTGKVTFSSATETGTFKSDTLTFIIPAHREKDFWTDALTQKINVTDTITHKMDLSVSFAKASTGRFTKTVQIPVVAKCNQILILKLRMQDVNVEIKPEVLLWDTQSVNGDVGAPYLNVSNVETTVYDGAVSRIHFWSNQPADSVYVTRAGKEDGLALTDVNTRLDRLAGATAVNRYYDPATQSGYIDIANLTLAGGQKDVKIYLKAAGLQREITVKRTASDQALNSITTPYVGTFHRWNQTGERVVTWNYTGGDWTAYIDNPTTAGVDVVIDRFASPALQNGTLYGASPGEAEGYKVSDGVRSVTGQNRIYLRVGWRSNAPNPYQPRYATITIRKGTNDTAGAVIQKLYLRQGEEADYLMLPSDAVSSDGMNSSTRPEAVKFTPYNLTDPNMGTGGSNLTDHKQLNLQSVSAGENRFTQYPTQAGAFFQWAVTTPNERRAYHPTNSTELISGWHTLSPSNYWDMLDAENETCPPGYRRPNDGAINTPTTGAVVGSEMRQSLYRNPQTGTTSNLSNASWGYYADGFFDRRPIQNGLGIGGGTNMAVSNNNKDAAYVGCLFFNSNNNASLFFPAAGLRDNTEGGGLKYSGSTVAYWSSSSNDAQKAGHLVLYKQGASQEVSDRTNAFSIRCVKVPTHRITFHANGGRFADGSSIKTIEVTMGNSCYLLPQPTYALAGTRYAVWGDQATGDLTPANTFSPELRITPTGDMIFYARWFSSRLFFGHNGWAGSNIYWDGSKLTFDDMGQGDERRQGVYFMWGSLVALSPMGNWTGGSQVLHISNTNQATNGGWNTDNTGWGYIPRLGWQASVSDATDTSSNPANGGVASAMIPIQYEQNQSYTYEHHNDTKNIGDICKYITDKGWAPGADESPRVEWRMPINVEFGPTGKGTDYVQIGSLSSYQASTNANGNATYAMGFRKMTVSAGSGTPFFPAAGYRWSVSSNIPADTADRPGAALAYWSGSQGQQQVGSPTVRTNGGALDYYGLNITYSLGFDRNTAAPVRCVRVN